MGEAEGNGGGDEPIFINVTICIEFQPTHVPENALFGKELEISIDLLHLEQGDNVVPKLGLNPLAHFFSLSRR